MSTSLDKASTRKFHRPNGYGKTSELDKFVQLAEPPNTRYVMGDDSITHQNSSDIATIFHTPLESTTKKRRHHKIVKITCVQEIMIGDNHVNFDSFIAKCDPCFDAPAEFGDYTADTISEFNDETIFIAQLPRLSSKKPHCKKKIVTTKNNHAMLVDSQYYDAIHDNPSQSSQDYMGDGTDYHSSSDSEDELIFQQLRSKLLYLPQQAPIESKQIPLGSQSSLIEELPKNFNSSRTTFSNLPFVPDFPALSTNPSLALASPLHHNYNRVYNRVKLQKTTNHKPFSSTILDHPLIKYNFDQIRDHQNFHDKVDDIIIITSLDDIDEELSLSPRITYKQKSLMNKGDLNTTTNRPTMTENDDFDCQELLQHSTYSPFDLFQLIRLYTGELNQNNLEKLVIFSIPDGIEHSSNFELQTLLHSSSFESEFSKEQK